MKIIQPLSSDLKPEDLPARKLVQQAPTLSPDPVADIPDTADPSPDQPIGGGMKIIQPLTPGLKAEDYQPRIPVHAPAPSQAPAPTTTETTPQPEQPVVDPLLATQNTSSNSSTPPEITKGMFASFSEVPTPANNKEDSYEELTYATGYSIGTTIFWFQLLAAVAFEIVFFIIKAALLRSTNFKLVIAVVLIYYLIYLFVLVLVPYKILKSNNVKKPISLTIFGFATQAVIVSILYTTIIFFIIDKIITYGIAYSITHNIGKGVGPLVIILYIVFAVAFYLLNKVAWGVAFLLMSKIKSDLAIKLISGAIIAVLLAVIVTNTYHNQHRDNGHSAYKISNQTLSTTPYIDATTGYSIKTPVGWTADELPVSSIDGQQQTYAHWYYENDIIANISVITTSPNPESLQSEVENWSASRQANNNNYRITSSRTISINGVSADYLTESWVSKTLVPEAISDQLVTENYNGVEYQIDGYSYAKYDSSFSSVIRASLLSFKP
jgi:hypothetical protein